MVVPAQDVVDSEKKEAANAVSVRAALHGQAQLARLGGENEFAGDSRRLDPGERVMVVTEHIEEVIANQQAPDPGGAGEVHDQCHALDLGPRRLHESLDWL